MPGFSRYTILYISLYAIDSNIEIILNRNQSTLQYIYEIYGVQIQEIKQTISFTLEMNQKPKVRFYPYHQDLLATFQLHV